MGAQDLIVGAIVLGAVVWLVVRSRRRSRSGACPGCNACPAAKAGAGDAPPPAAGGLVKIDLGR